jgi:CRP-like cAMP-binding protein
MMGATRRRTRQNVKTIFEGMGLHGLRREQFASLVHQVKSRLFLLPPHFDSQTDWKLLLGLSEDIPDEGEETKITFVQFERWWKYRCGLLEADTPVIPEFFEFKMAEISLADRLKVDQERRKLVQALPQQFSLHVRGGSKTFDVQQLVDSGFQTTRTGAELWRLIRSRLKMLLAMRRDWGNIDTIYGQCESDFGQTDLKWYVRDPSSTFSTIWDGLQVIFLLYVSWTVPLRACFGLDVEWPSLAFVADVCVDLYFIFDFIGNFFTAYFDQNGVREGRLEFIARRYITGWFAIDFVSCIPIDYIVLAASDRSEAVNGETDGSNLRAVKTLRLVRLSKMLRLAHLQRTLAKYENLEFVQTWADVGGLIFSILLIAHMLTCIWYAIGLNDNFFDLGRHRPGWVLQELCDCNDSVWDNNPPLCETYVVAGDCPQDRCRWDRSPYVATVPANTETCIPQVLCEVGCEERADVSLTWRYVTSLYYVLGSLEPKYQTLPERSFAVFAFVCVLIIEGAVAGVLSSILIRMGGKDQEVNDKLKAAKLWMREHRIPKDKAAKAMDYFRLVYKSRVMYEESAILNTMPPDMRLDFSTQLYEKFLKEVPLFRGLSLALIHSVCSIASPMMAVRKQVIYSEGSTGKEMYVLISGELEITAGGERLGFLSDGSFFGETPILDQAASAEVRRRTVTAMVDSKLCFIHKDAVKGLAARYPELALRLKRMARGEAKSKKKGRKLQEALDKAFNVLPSVARGSNDRSSTTPRDSAAHTSLGAAEPEQTIGLSSVVQEQLAHQQRQLAEQRAQLTQQQELLKTIADTLQKLQAPTSTT